MYELCTCTYTVLISSAKKLLESDYIFECLLTPEMHVKIYYLQN